jgi:hypothetical protein
MLDQNLPKFRIKKQLTLKGRLCYNHINIVYYLSIFIKYLKVKLLFNYNLFVSKFVKIILHLQTNQIVADIWILVKTENYAML